MDDTLTEIPLNKLVFPWVLLRPVFTNSIDYMEMLESLRDIGWLNSISVRPSKREEGRYEVIDGMWRLTCARELEFETAPCIIKYDVSDEDVLAFQIQANAIRPTTTPIEFAQQIRRIQKTQHGITMAELANLVNKKPSWIQLQLGLLRLSPTIQKCVDRGEICLGNAYNLVRIPPRFRWAYVDDAKTMPTSQFAPIAIAVVKQFQEAVMAGKLEAFYQAEFKVTAHLRSLKEVRAEYDDNVEGPLVVTSEKCNTPLQGWNAALQWALHLDPVSANEQEIAARSRAHKKWVKEPNEETEND